MKRMVNFFCLLLVWAAASAQEAFVKNEFVSERGDTLRYCFLEPEVLEPGTKYPLVLFLHGAGERGTDNEAQLTHGAQMWLNPVNREQYPAFVLLPQCPPDGYWAYGDRPASLHPAEMPLEVSLSSVFRSLEELLDTWLSKPEVDKERIYVMGLSMGGMGTYDLVIRHPDLFAAAIPICGTVNPARFTPALKQVKFRIFHGDADTVVPVEGSRAAYRALKKLGVEVKYTEFPGCTHGSWNPAFNQLDLMSWMFGQRK